MVANVIVAQFLFLQMSDPKKDIHFTSIRRADPSRQGWPSTDTLQWLTCDVNTYVVGMAASMGAVLRLCGHQGKAVRAAQRGHHDPPSPGRCRGAGQRCGDPGETHAPSEEAAE